MTSILKAAAQEAQLAAGLNYDYSRIPEQDRETVRAAAVEIKTHLRTTVEEMIHVGQALIEVRDRIPHGQWLPWLADEFALGERSASDFMNVARRFGGADAANYAQLPGSALRLLAAPSTPDAAIEEVQRRIETGTVPTVAEVKTVVLDLRTRTLNQIETEAVIARWLERHHNSDNLYSQRWRVLAMTIDEITHMIRPDRSIGPNTFEEAKRSIVAGITARMNEQAQPKPQLEPQPADAYEWLRTYVDYKDRTWRDLDINQVYHANSPCYQAFVKAHPTVSDPKTALRDALERLSNRKPDLSQPHPASVRGKYALPTQNVDDLKTRCPECTAGVSFDSDLGLWHCYKCKWYGEEYVLRTQDDHDPARPQQIRNVREAIADALDALDSVRADAGALGIDSYQIPINILNNILDRLDGEK